jgi:predicted CXXCH cytochrome family protein
MKKLLLVWLMLVAFIGYMSAAPTGKIKVVGVPDKFKSYNANMVTTSLKNVGKGQRVVLRAWAVAGTTTSDTLLTVTSAVWNLVGPGGSSATIADTGSTNMVYAYFVPDVTGSYTVEMTATTAEVGALPQVSITITAGTYKGAGIFNASTVSYDNFNCTPCHQLTSGVFAEFLKTNHASVMPRRLNDPAGHFSNNCVACHTVGVSGGTPPDNNNFEFVRQQLGWNVPHNGPNQYEDSLVALYPQLAILSGIQCENCHGPAGQHAGPGVNIDKSLSSEVCAPCHFSSDRHPKGYSWDASGHANSFAEGAEWNYMNRSGCSQCHTGNGYVEQTINGGTAGTYADPVGITCAACHDPHNNTNIYQLRRTSVAEACTGCHITRISSRGLHHSNQGPMIIGAGSMPYGPSEPTSGVGLWAGWELPGYVYENSSHEEIEERCAQCHMAMTPSFDPTYATPDTLLNKVGGHTFAVVWDRGTPNDETDDLLNYVGCEECHGKVTIDFVHLTQEKTHKLLDTLAVYLAKDTSGNIISFTNSSLTLRQKAGSYNYSFVTNDGSFGAHNFKYAEGLLKSSIEQLKLGQGSANIASIADVPNDQGKQVRIVWNQFPAEMFAFDRLAKYGVWRIDENPAAGESKASYRSMTEMLTSGPVGTEVVNGPTVFTFVGEVPASNLGQYGFIAPTLYDSTIVAGMKQSVFLIAGYTQDSRRLYTSDPDTGYSVDNLKPVQTSGVVAMNVPTGVMLKWNANPDPDIDHYNVYRGTTAGFDPNSTAPIAQVAETEYIDQNVTSGVKYYYVINAVDFSGNKGAFSPEVNVTVTGVSEAGGIPTEYALRQNYPNPFNPTTSIGFAVPKQAHVTLSIYTVSGELVATLVNEQMAPGNYNVTWNGENFSGTSVSSGIYLYRIQSGDFTAVRKMIMLK